MIVTLSMEETRLAWLISNGCDVSSGDYDLHADLRKRLRPCAPTGDGTDYTPFSGEMVASLITYLSRMVEAQKQVRGGLVEDMVSLRNKVKVYIQAAAADPPK